MDTLEVGTYWVTFSLFPTESSSFSEANHGAAMVKTQDRTHEAETVTYPFFFTGIFTEATEDVLHSGEASGEREQQVDHLVQVPDEHLVLVKLVGFAELTDEGLDLFAQGIVQLDVHEQASLCFLEGLELVGEASDELSLEQQESPMSGD